MRHARVLLLKHLLSPCSQVSLADGTALASQCPLPGGRQDMPVEGRTCWDGGLQGLLHWRRLRATVTVTTPQLSPVQSTSVPLCPSRAHWTPSSSQKSWTLTSRHWQWPSTVPDRPPYPLLNLLERRFPNCCPTRGLRPYQLNQKVREWKPGFSSSSGDFNFRQFGNHNQRGVQSLDATVFQRLPVSYFFLFLP